MPGSTSRTVSSLPSTETVVESGTTTCLTVPSPALTTRSLPETHTRVALLISMVTVGMPVVEVEGEVS